MTGSDEFYTLKGYQINNDLNLTYAMEDYLEMISRMALENESIRVIDLAKMLHVKPSSVTKMMQHLNQLEYINAEKYGLIHLTKKGKEAGDYLLYRHNVINKFLCLLNNSQNELEQAEKIEHFLNCTTVKNLDILSQKISHFEITSK